MNNQMRCPGCGRLIGIDVIGNFEIDYSSNLVKSMNEYNQFPPYIVEHKCKYCKAMSSLYAWASEGVVNSD